MTITENDGSQTVNTFDPKNRVTKRVGESLLEREAAKTVTRAETWMTEYHAYCARMLATPPDIISSIIALSRRTNAVVIVIDPPGVESLVRMASPGPEPELGTPYDFLERGGGSVRDKILDGTRA